MPNTTVLKTLNSKGHLVIKSTSVIPLNGSAPLGYRIVQTDRVVGDPATGHADGFVVLNLSSGNAFIVSGGLWASTSFPADLLDAWYATIAGTPVSGYRIGTTDRVIGSPTTASNGFVVINSTNGNIFQAASGLWGIVNGLYNPTNIIAAWKNA